MAILVVLNYSIHRHPYIICIIKNLQYTHFFLCVALAQNTRSSKFVFVNLTCTGEAIGDRGHLWIFPTSSPGSPLPFPVPLLRCHLGCQLFTARSFLCEPFVLWVLMILWMTLHLHLWGITDGICISIKTFTS